MIVGTTIASMMARALSRILDVGGADRPLRIEDTAGATGKHERSNGDQACLREDRPLTAG